jgi:protoheme IX farnesyltransferase
VESWPLAVFSLLAIAIGAGASGALNMWWDADIDAVMSRTQGRPIPSGRVPATEAAMFGGIMALLSVWLLALTANYLAAGLLAFTIFFYVVIYSMGLKRRTPQNIVIGGAAGALPPMVGWAAVTGDIGLGAWLLFGIIFLWTPPHFWALALVKSEDYARAGIPMMPNAKGKARTRFEILVYAVLFVGLAIGTAFTDMAGNVYLAVATIGGIYFLWRSVQVYQYRDDRSAMQLFGYSILYLFLLFLAVLGEHWMGVHG